MEKPIIFNTPMIKAILEGRKTQTRRVIKAPYEIHQEGNRILVTRPRNFKNEYCRFHSYECPYGKPGNILWVRETWRNICDVCGREYCVGCKGYGYYASTEEPEDLKWRPSIHMPREAARLFLKVKNIRVERLQDITQEDARAEGITSEWAYECNNWSPSYSDPDSGGKPDYIAGFSCLWDSIYESQGYGWDKNPWVWVIEFEKQ